MTIIEAYNQCVECLIKANIDEADFKSLCLVCSIVDIKNSEFKFHQNDLIDDTTVLNAIDRMVNGEPLQYVIGKWDFYDSEFYVGNGVLIPRPETEELVDMAIKTISKLDSPIVYDLCAGSGCIGLSVAKKCKNARVFLVEKSEKAFSYLSKNAEGISNAQCINDDIFNDIDLPIADVIISNPPYIKTSDMAMLQAEVQREPSMALDGGNDGLDFYRIINSKWSSKIKPNGYLMLEIGNEQGEDIKDVLTNFKDVAVHKDIYKNDRIVTARPID